MALRKKVAPIAVPVPNPMVVPGLSNFEEDDDLTMAGDEDLHDYSEEEINGLWREKALHTNEQRRKNKERPFFLQLISWQKNRIVWEAFDSVYGQAFFQADQPHIRIQEMTLPSVTLVKQWVLNENWEWVETPGEILDKLKNENPSLTFCGIIGVCQPTKNPHFSKNPEKSVKSKKPKA